MGSVVGSGPEVREVLWYQETALMKPGLDGTSGGVGGVP